MTTERPLVYSRVCVLEGYRELQKLLTDRTYTPIGIWWLWRCFDGYNDQHARAAVVAITFRDRFFLVDILKLDTLEKARQGLDGKYKRLLLSILKAKHLLKVVHYLEGTGLRALQLALITEEEREGDEKPTNYADVSPTIDLCWVMAYLHGTSGRQEKELPGLVWKYLRWDLCVTEALSNFERRPLRESQKHYALSLAWCPLVILRAVCAHGLVREEVVTSLCIVANGDWVTDKRDEAWAMHRENFGDGSSFAGAGGEEDQRNIWEETRKSVEREQWEEARRQVAEEGGSIRSARGDWLMTLDQEPEDKDYPLEVILPSQAVRQFRLKNEDVQGRQPGLERARRTAQKPVYWNDRTVVKDIVAELFNKEMSDWELKALYDRQESYRPPWRREGLAAYHASCDCRRDGRSDQRFSGASRTRGSSARPDPHTAQTHRGRGGRKLAQNAG
eukprot:g17351.t1